MFPYFEIFLALKFVFYTFSTFNYPPTIFRYDIATKKSTVFRSPEVDFKATDFETKQVFYISKDGTKVPMFIVYKKGLKLNGQNPTLLYGYGGFNVNLNPGFSPTLIPFLEQGGVYASANLRGGGEYGEKWHEQGMKLKKQNVFDDFNVGLLAAEQEIVKPWKQARQSVCVLIEQCHGEKQGCDAAFLHCFTKCLWLQDQGLRYHQHPRAIQERRPHFPGGGIESRVGAMRNAVVRIDRGIGGVDDQMCDIAMLDHHALGHSG